MSRKKDLRKAAEKTQHSAAETAALAVEEAVSFLAPYVEAARDSVAPAAKQAAERSADLAHKARKNIDPYVHDAIDRVSPAVDTAKAKVQADLMPKLVDLLHEAEKHPAVREAEKRGAATLAAVRGDLALPEKKRKGKVGRTIAKVIAATALLAGAAVAVKQFLGSKDEGWTAHQPSPAYTPKAETLLDDAAAPEADAPEAPVADVTESTATEAYDDGAAPGTTEDPVAEDAVIAEPDVVTEGEADDEMVAEGGPVFNQADTTRHGEGSWIGDDKPEGYVIKGNERSMKYHVPESGGYDRTNADVWFVSEEAATAAGFTRAQR
uniref:sunset domain-containing protein n=1 Tax=Aestuariimicrobium ganziense TaxID=2773677 RepID=UPI0019453CC7|nr:hypothetical protein [Aestuariimicrobium ganziense]